MEFRQSWPNASFNQDYNSQSALNGWQSQNATSEFNWGYGQIAIDPRVLIISDGQNTNDLASDAFPLYFADASVANQTDNSSSHHPYAGEDWANKGSMNNLSHVATQQMGTFSGPEDTANAFLNHARQGNTHPVGSALRAERIFFQPGLHYRGSHPQYAQQTDTGNQRQQQHQMSFAEPYQAQYHQLFQHTDVPPNLPQHQQHKQHHRTLISAAGTSRSLTDYAGAYQTRYQQPSQQVYVPQPRYPQQAQYQMPAGHADSHQAHFSQSATPLPTASDIATTPLVSAFFTASEGNADSLAAEWFDGVDGAASGFDEADGAYDHSVEVDGGDGNAPEGRSHEAIGTAGVDDDSMWAAHGGGFCDGSVGYGVQGSGVPSQPTTQHQARLGNEAVEGGVQLGGYSQGGGYNKSGGEAAAPDHVAVSSFAAHQGGLRRRHDVRNGVHRGGGAAVFAQQNTTEFDGSSGSSIVNASTPVVGNYCFNNNVMTLGVNAASTPPPLTTQANTTRATPAPALALHDTTGTFPKTPSSVPSAAAANTPSAPCRHRSAAAPRRGSHPSNRIYNDRRRSLMRDIKNLRKVAHAHGLAVEPTAAQLESAKERVKDARSHGHASRSLKQVGKYEAKKEWLETLLRGLEGEGDVEAGGEEGCGVGFGG